ncbi:MAG: IS1634 family transposase [Thermoplasmata archaeon]
MHLYFKRRGRQTYVYLRQKGRVDGKVVNTADIYLGTQDEIIRRLTAAPEVGGLEFLPYPFGTAAAFLAADEELGFSRVVEQVTGNRATALSLLAFIIGRAHEPVSKNGMTEWADRSLFRFLKGIPSLSSRRYLERMDRLTDPVVEAITLHLGRELVKRGHRPSLVFFDPTNFSTEQQPDPDDLDRQLARPGHAKDGNFQAKLVGLATATTETHLPVYHRVFPGNKNDIRLFQEIVGTMVAQLQKLGVAAEDLCFVFDKGVGSKTGFAALGEGGAHFVSSLKRVQVRDLLEHPLSAYRELYVTEQGEPILGFRTAREVMGVKGVVVAAHNESARKRQEIDYERAKARFLEGTTTLASKMSKPHRGRRSTTQSVTERVEDLLPKKWRGVFKYRVGATLEERAPRFTVRAWVDAKKEALLRLGFGKTVVFTDRTDWEDERIVRTYYARSGQEEDFHVLKDVLLLPVMPIFHRRDRRIKVHAFLCVVGLLFYRWVQLRVAEVTKQRIPIGRLGGLLDRIQVVAVMKSGSKEVKVVLQKLDPERSAIVKALGLARFVPK